MTDFTNKVLILTVSLLFLFPAEVLAFGAGDIPDFAYLNDKAFRHGDIENVLEELAKTAGGVALGGGIMNIASSVLQQVSGGSKFSRSDIKKVYFGNWLRDYSQAMDIAGLNKLTADTLVLVVSILGFMTFGFSTQEFEVTADRLGVYLPVEHIDNPKGYAEKEGDARKFHPKLRPPVRREELEIDERTGMKKYMATENQGWDTSTAFIRRTFRFCIEHGRRAQGREGPDLWEAYRLLGTGLHTMEDLLAHSNWCEIALQKMGRKEVFCHVGDNVIINTPNGRAPPLVTGTFGSADFLHSLLGEAGDKLSQASVTDLSAKLNNAQGNTPDIGILKNIFSKFGGGNPQQLEQGSSMQKKSEAYQFNPDNIAPPVVKERLLEVLKWHDDVMRDITKKIEMVPGLSQLLEEFSNAMNEYIYTVIAPYVTPILTSATGALDEGSKAVIDNDDQYEVFDNPDAHDPSHSLLSKDHFGLILNEPAGKIARVVVRHTVGLIVRAWNEQSNPDEVITQILEAFHHPFYANRRSEIQSRMFDEMEKWLGGLGEESREVIQSLTKDAVRNHRNKRKGLEDTQEPGYGCGHGQYNKPNVPAKVSGGYGSSGTSSYQGNTGDSQYGRQSGGYSAGGQGLQRHDKESTRYDSRNDDQTYSNRYEQQNVASSGNYGQKGGDYPSGYGDQRQRREDSSYKVSDTSYSQQRDDSRRDNSNYGQSPSYDTDQRDKSSYGGGYGKDSYGTNRTEDDNTRSGYSGRSEHHKHGHQSQEQYGDSSGYGSTGNPGYGQTQQPYGSGYSPEYSRPQEVDDKRGGTGYGHKPSRRDDSDSDGRHGRHEDKKFGASDEEQKHHKHRHDKDENLSYGQPSYGQSSNPSYGGGDDTYGVERLDIRGDSNRDTYGERKRHQGGGGGGGYGY